MNGTVDRQEVYEVFRLSEAHEGGARIPESFASESAISLLQLQNAPSS